jgi:pimeloyl-ACP methyl ester carboxylesterase
MLLALWLMALVHGATPAPQEATRALVEARQQVDARRFVLVPVPAPGLADALGDPGTAHVGVQLPRREAECLAGSTPCWLVIYLCGFDSSPEGFAQGLAPAVDAFDQREGAPPVVVVVVDGRTRLGGGWYLDSHAEGAWQSFVLGTLLPAAREALAPGTPAARTLLMGHSMGGFGALHLGATQPRHFHAVAAFNPVVRPGSQADAILARLEAQNQPPDAEARLKDGAPGHFYERVLLSEGGAFLDDLHAPHGLAPLINAAVHPWRLSADAAQAFAAQDLVTHARRLQALPRVEVFGGRTDPLIPVADLEALAKATNGSSRARLTLIVTDGDHLNHLASDLGQALLDLTR